MMDFIDIIILSAIILVVAILYSSVGQGGASAYLAAMGVFSLAPVVMKPTALILNILVAGIGSISYYRTGAFEPNIFWPFVLGSIPMAWWGSTIPASPLIYKFILGTILIFTSCWVLSKKNNQKNKIKKSFFPLKVALGGVIGFLAGFTGIGGGVLLSPILILNHWAEPRKTSGIAAAFIFVNSIVGILGHLSVSQFPPSFICYFIVAAGIGGLIGSFLGSKKLTGKSIKKVLAIILLLAGIQLAGFPIYNYLLK